jgi:DNA-binding transcriptional regulator GbsR (MarR family)
MIDSDSKPKETISPIRVDMELDLYGLNPYEFRIYGHIARRNKCYANLKTIAAICKMSVRQAQYALKNLTEKKLITKTIRKGSTDIYQIADKSKWEKPDYTVKINTALEYFNRAIIRREKKDFNGAVEDFEQSIKLYELELKKNQSSTRKGKDIQDARKELEKTQERLISSKGT